MTMPTTHYDNLQVARRSTDAVIRAAYRVLCQKYHPDKYDGEPAEAERIMKLITRAYSVLSDPVERKKHDAWIVEQESMAENSDHAETARAGEYTATRNSTQETFHATEADRAFYRSRYDNTEHHTSRGSSSDGLGPDRKQTAVPSGKKSEFNFASVFVACLIGAWFITRRSLEMSHLTFSTDVLYSLGMYTGFAGMLIGAGFVTWLIMRFVFSMRRYAAWTAMIFSSSLFIAMWWGGEIQKELVSKSPTTQVVAPKVNAATAQLTNAAANENLKRLYDQAVKEIEAKHPELNPDLPGYQRNAAQDILKSARTYEKNGLPPHEALNRAVAERERNDANTFVPWTVSAPISTRELTAGESGTIFNACYSFQESGDLVAYRSCVTSKTNTAKASSLPSEGNLTAGEQSTLFNACYQFQEGGDIVGYQRCVRQQLARLSR